MGMHEKIIPANPPAPRAVAVVEHLQACKRALVTFEQEIPARLLDVAEKRPGAEQALATLREKIAAVEFAIKHHAKTRSHTEQLDEMATVEFKRAVQRLPVEDILEGLSRDQCPRCCIAGTGCAITGADPLAGPCAHPVLVGALELDRYRENPQIMRVYSAACAKLGLRSNR